MKELACDLALGQGTCEFFAGSLERGSYFQEHVIKLKGYQQPARVLSGHLPSPPSVLEALQRNANPS